MGMGIRIQKLISTFGKKEYEILQAETIIRKHID